jgi:sugar/nucleoside kinase (ribokinase family)
MSKKLLPCPFCGGEARTFEYDGANQATCCVVCGMAIASAASPVVPVGREAVEVVAEWLEIAKETPKPLHSSLNYVPVCASEIEAIERILAALRPTDTGRE